MTEEQFKALRELIRAQIELDRLHRSFGPDITTRRDAALASVAETRR